MQFVPVVLSLLLLGAHFLRAEMGYLLPVVFLLLALLLVRRPWAARVVQAALVLAAVEWIRTLVVLSGLRAQAGQPLVRLVIILGVVAAVTFLSALIFQSKTMGRIYGLGEGRTAEGSEESHPPEEDPESEPKV